MATTDKYDIFRKESWTLGFKHKFQSQATIYIDERDRKKGLPSS